MDELEIELKEKEKEMEQLEQRNSTLIVRERQSNDELVQARKELIQGLAGEVTNRAGIGIKRMGEVNSKPFATACRKKFPADEADIKAQELCSLWQEYVGDPSWHPFKVVTEGENF